VCTGEGAPDLGAARFSIHLDVCKNKHLVCSNPGGALPSRHLLPSLPAGEIPPERCGFQSPQRALGSGGDGGGGSGSGGGGRDGDGVSLALGGGAGATGARGVTGGSGEGTLEVEGVLLSAGDGGKARRLGTGAANGTGGWRGWIGRSLEWNPQNRTTVGSSPPDTCARVGRTFPGPGGQGRSTPGGRGRALTGGRAGVRARGARGGEGAAGRLSAPPPSSPSSSSGYATIPPNPISSLIFCFFSSCSSARPNIPAFDCAVLRTHSKYFF